ncbi:cystathionine gamma-synthase family protein [Pseudemcibacter aquimaris]|uniref:cystathionine gamma-synthase family protein n=1 Tax=Pseudemcibacter aquimaris TaxID=2857064 RepID=UPI002011E8E0|nr:cystathionine gamma-synthase family protein [Pseudemcibacter aquimaris]MCC3861244.1 cystathionine gamma-synthase family protein [Pseudemcibacter aquimaris]WDU58018.1 cystathionine gamma-synthase family protein [Pseudemcibacter aquimaris]
MTDKNWDNIDQATMAVWAGEEKTFLEGCAQVPIVNSVSYSHDDVDEWFEVATGKREGHIYSRNTNPTVDVFEEKMRVLEGAEAATSFSTGMAAISNALFTFLSPGQRVVSTKDTYGGTSVVFLEHLPRFGVDVSLVETTDMDAIEAEVDKGCDLLYLETPTNPTMKVLDLKRLIAYGKERGAIVIVDNTFATPINQNPLALGADLVVHSATKFLGGHSDAMGGILCGKEDLIKKAYSFREINGASLDANSAYLLLRGLKTLKLRVKQQNENALALAKYLEGHDKVEKVFYPGLENDPGHEIAKGQMRGFTGMLSFSLKGGFDSVRKFLPSVKYAHRAAHLGGVETILGPPRTASHVELTEEQRAALGIPESLIRCSVGIEDIDDIIADFEQAMKSL